jgi:SNF family Na+-dependent transporter
MNSNKNPIQIIWGIVLSITGILVVLQVPEKFNQMGDIASNNMFAKGCFYGLGIFLFIGGIKKLIDEFKNKPASSDNT